MTRQEPSSGALSRFGRDLAPGTVLFREGDTGAEMFVIQSGQVRISKRVANGDKVLATLGPSTP